ncbi:hypothetical protein DV737_g861, partial [Chaetothyriales sp. CBS 132003]
MLLLTPSLGDCANPDRGPRKSGSHLIGRPSRTKKEPPQDFDNAPSTRIPFELISPKMMSNPPPSLPPQPPRGKGFHRRQHSTPVNALEAMRVLSIDEAFHSTSNNEAPFAVNQEACSPFFASPDLFQAMPLVDENNPHCFSHMQAMPSATAAAAANAMFDVRRMSQPDLRIQTHMRPRTPQDQIQSGRSTVPILSTVRHGPYARSLQASPSLQSPVPVAMQRGHSLQGIIEHEESKDEPPRRPRPRSMMVTSTVQPFDMADLAASSAQLLASSASPLAEPQKHEPLPFFDETGGEEPRPDIKPNLESKPVPILASSQPNPRGSMSPCKPALSPRRMSISDLNLEPGISASIEETNITLDDIAQFIEGPMPEDNKWVCRYEDCNKRFGRKENIKSHVQTHLGDRQFRCGHCKKCFVRGHDLKRHAKIHTGSKPYPCLCGNSFARHDALTRHRQRGMCIGAFEGVVKKVTKRGRPRKHRPEMDDRLDKANRTRARNELHYSAAGHTDAYLSSGSSDGTMSSWGSPPTENMDNLSIRGASPFDDPALFAVNNNDLAATINLNNLDGLDMALAPNMFSFTPPASPGFSTGNPPSPLRRSATPTTDICELVNIRPATAHSEDASLGGLADQAASPMMDAHLHALPPQVSQSQMSHSLPGLSHTSSSPAPPIDAFDFPDLPQQTPLISAALPSKLEERNDFDTLFDYGMDINPDSFFTNI